MTAIRLVCASILLVATMLAAPARAQEVTRLPDTAKQAVSLDAGLDAAFVARASYARRVDFGFAKDTRLYARFTLPFVGPDLGDWAIDGGARLTAIERGAFRLSMLGGPVVRSASNGLFSATAIGVGATLLVGFEAPRWGVSAELGYEQLLATHLRHSDDYRAYLYAGAKDGFYALSGSRLRAGLRGGVRFGAVELFAKAGWEATGRLNAISPPFYATIGSAYTF
jgi:hypothetical protein